MSGRLAWRVWILHGGLRAVRAACARIDAAAAGVALGMMDRPHLHALDKIHYDRSAIYSSTEHNLQGLRDWEREALERWFDGRRRIGIVGAGGGREVLALARLGREVDGFECNPTLLLAANRLLAAEGCAARVRPLPRDAAPEPAAERRHAYDGLIVGWGAYMLIPGHAQRVAFLRGLGRLVDGGAPLLVSFFTRSPEHSRFRLVASVANLLRRWRRAQPVDLGDDMLPNYVHRFTEDEIRGEMVNGGFELVDFAPEGRGPFASGWAVGRRL